jgi:hypothetical protein
VSFVNPKQFLIIGGIILVLIAILGFVGVIGPTASQSIFGSHWWFDNGENWAHLVLGAVGLIAAFAFPASVQKFLVVLLGIVGVLIGIYSIFTPSFLGANLENPADTILHLAVGIWALCAAFKKPAMMGSMPSSGM